MAAVYRMCPYCGRTIGDRTRTKCPNFAKHVETCERNRKERQAKAKKD